MTRLFVLGSQSQKKIIPLDRAIRQTLDWEKAHIKDMKAKSYVWEQPYGDKHILEGAMRRVNSAKTLFDGEDGVTEYLEQMGIRPEDIIFMSAENGIVPEDSTAPGFTYNGLTIPACDYSDYGLTLGWLPAKGVMLWERSATCKFPWEAVKLTLMKEGGFELNTVGKTLYEMGLVKDHADPHIDLCGISRVDLLVPPMQRVIQRLLGNMYL